MSTTCIVMTISPVTIHPLKSCPTQESRTSDLLFLIDATGSMSGVIEATKRMILEIVKTTRNAPYPHAGWKLCLGFVAYRDFTIVPQFDVQDFTSSTDEFSAALADVIAHSRGSSVDCPEDVFGAIELATMLSWEGVSRTIIHVGDAPCHGAGYHNDADNYAGGDPLKRDIKAMFTALKKRCKVSTLNSVG